MGQDTWSVAELDARAGALLQKLTLEEKASLTVGRDTWTTQPIERLGIPSIWLSDGPTGIRKSRTAADIGLGTSWPATCFPTESCLASSWDVDLVGHVGTALGKEAQACDVQVLLGPGVNLKRSPLCGRNFEYFSEDPVLSGELAAAFIAGVQRQGVGTSLKHFVANEQETGRMYVDSVVDERTLRELYLRPFEIAIAKASPMTLMCAYNRLNGTFCAEHRRLLHQIAVEEWGFDGIIMSDWGAVNDRVAGIDAGLHLQMPAGSTAELVVQAVREGRLAEARLDAVVRPLLRVILAAHAARVPEATTDFDAHHALARRAAAESAVLLKNEGHLLPLAGEKLAEVAVIGTFAKLPRYQGSGSSQVVPTRMDTLYGELVRLVEPAGHVTYAAGYAATHAVDAAMLQEAQGVARQARVAVVVVGLPSTFEEEGADRTHIDLPESHTALIEAVCAVQRSVVVVLLNGSAVAMPWVSRVPAIVEGWLGGQAGGGALADVLTGVVNPSGKLAETFPVRLQDTPSFLSFPGDGYRTVQFSEGLYSGYRWYDARSIEPLFPFGHGLSYTSFSYSELVLDKENVLTGESLGVSLRIRNTGSVRGKEVVQLYVRDRQPRRPRPDKELKAFAKVDLEPGEETDVRFTLHPRDFMFYDPAVTSWVTSGGVFDVLVGSSSRDIRLHQSVTIEASNVLRPPLDRMSTVRDWLAHPAGRELIGPALDVLRRWLTGEDKQLAGEPSGTTDAVLDGFFLDLPVAKLVVFGALPPADLERLLAEASE